MMARPLRFAVALLLALAAQAVHAGEYQKIYDSLEPIAKLKGLKYVQPKVKVTSAAAGTAPIVFTIKSKSGAIQVPVLADGSMAFPMSQALYDENPAVETNQPPKSVSLSVSVDVLAPPARRFDYRLIAEMRNDWNEAVRRQSLFWRLLAPSPKGAVITFEPGRAATAEVKLPQGVRRLTADDKGEIRIAFDDAWGSANPSFELSDLPKRIALTFKDK